jgi:hypothetical protein
MGLFKGFQSAGTARHRVMSSERGDESDFTKTAMKRAIKSHEPIDYDPDNHFRGVKKMVRLGCGAELAIKECKVQLPDRSRIGVPADHLSSQQTS